MALARRILPITAALLATVAATLVAQGKAPRRPRLSRDADTCDAYAYYQYGLEELQEEPERAVSAFYWAQRLSPGSAVTYYGERIALLMEDASLLQHYVEADRRTLASAAVQRIDSLHLRALDLDPFFPEQLDEELIVAYFKNMVREWLRGHGEQTGEGDIDFYVRREIGNADMETRAWLAFGRGNYREAVNTWGQQERSERKNAHLRARRAQAFFLLGLQDSARAELDSALTIARRADAEKMTYVYDSKARWEYQLGRIEEMRGRDPMAREAYQRTLVEDLSFQPAHVRLAYVALRLGDTTEAITELRRAIEIKGDEYTSRFALGTVYAARHATDSATAQLRRAIEIEPWVAQPHFVLADVRRVAGDRDGAAAAYRDFVALAARSDPSLGIAQQRLAALTTSAP